MREKICGAQLVLTKRMSRLTVYRGRDGKHVPSSTFAPTFDAEANSGHSTSVPSIQLRSEQTTHDQQTAHGQTFIVARAMLRGQEPARPLHVWSSLSRYSFPGFKAVFSLFSPATIPQTNSTRNAKSLGLSPKLTAERRHAGPCPQIAWRLD